MFSFHYFCNEIYFSCTFKYLEFDMISQYWFIVHQTNIPKMLTINFIVRRIYFNTLIIFTFQELFLSQTGAGTASRKETFLSTTVSNSSVPPGGSISSFRQVPHFTTTFTRTVLFEPADSIDFNSVLKSASFLCF